MTIRQKKIVEVCPTGVGMNRLFDCRREQLGVCPTGVGMNRLDEFAQHLKSRMPHRRGDEPQVQIRRDQLNLYAPQAWG